MTPHRHGKIALVLFAAVAAVSAGSDVVVSTTNSTATSSSEQTDDILSLYALDDDYVPDEGMLMISNNLPKPFALFSMICSYAMIREVVTDQRTGSGTPISRILFSIAVADVLFSFAWFLGAWPFPSYSLFGGNGSIPFCTFQGVLKMFGLAASVMFNASLSIFFLLMVRYKWPDRKLRKIEPWMQGSIWLVCLVLALYPIPLELYNPDWDICSVQSHPIDCSGDDCLRGQDPAPHQMLFAVLPWGCLALSLISLGMILCSVRKLENQNSRYATSMTAAAAAAPPSSNLRMSKISASLMMSLRRSQAKDTLRLSKVAKRDHNNFKSSMTSQTQVSHQVNRRNSKAVVMQAVCYTLAFLLTYMLEFIAAMRYITTNNYNAVFDFLTYGVFFVSAGTFNFLVFSRTRVQMKTCEGRFLRALLCCTCSWCPHRRWWCSSNNHRDGNNSSRKETGKTRLTSADDSTSHPALVEESAADGDVERPTAEISKSNNAGGAHDVLESTTSGDEGNERTIEKGTTDCAADNGAKIDDDGAQDVERPAAESSKSDNAGGAQHVPESSTTSGEHEGNQQILEQEPIDAAAADQGNADPPTNDNCLAEVNQTKESAVARSGEQQAGDCNA